jgi:hypothetical protein
MRAIDFPDFAEWCKANGYALENWRPSLPSATRHLRLQLPDDVQDLAQLLHDLVHLDAGEERLVWLRDWTIWGERSQEIGLRHWDLLVKSLRGSEELRASILVLKEGEWREAIALLSVPVLYGWDAHLMFRSAGALVSFSHDGWIGVSLRDGVHEVLDSWARDLATTTDSVR